MGPYRTEERDERAVAPRDPGIVGDVIAQFADPYAFFRELVQNAIDAGTETVEVRLEHDAGAGLVRASVRDRGEGMTRDVVENQLLVLFRSTKERDDTKIGKFGIGFASVLAPSPQVVVVQTARAGRRLTLHLHPDLTYQLFDGGAATQTGTTVQLELAMPAVQAVEFAERSRAALVRWCRHARCRSSSTSRSPLPATGARIGSIGRRRSRARLSSCAARPMEASWWGGDGHSSRSHAGSLLATLVRGDHPDRGHAHLPRAVAVCCASCPDKQSALRNALATNGGISSPDATVIARREVLRLLFLGA